MRTGHLSRVFAEDDRALLKSDLELLDSGLLRCLQADAVLVLRRLTLFGHIHVVTHVAEGLSLWVDDDWVLPVYALINDDHVLISRCLVGKAPDGPLADFLLISKHLLEGEIWRELDLVALSELHPCILQYFEAISAFEGPKIVEEACCKDHVS